MSIHWLDIAILTILAYFIIRGFLRGLTGIATKFFAGILISIFILKFSGTVKTFILSFINIPGILSIITSFVILAGTGFIIAYCLRSLARNYINNKNTLRKIEKLGGLLFGAIKGLVIVSVLLIGIMRLPMQSGSITKLRLKIRDKTYVASYIVKVVPKMIGLIHKPSINRRNNK